MAAVFKCDVDDTCDVGVAADVGDVVVDDVVDDVVVESTVEDVVDTIVVDEGFPTIFEYRSLSIASIPILGFDVVNVVVGIVVTISV